MIVLFHPGDLDTTGWLIVGLFALLIVAAAVGAVVGLIYLLIVLAKKNGERINRKKRQADNLDLP